jgi:hypothetical protein
MTGAGMCEVGATLVILIWDSEIVCGTRSLKNIKLLIGVTGLWGNRPSLFHRTYVVINESIDAEVTSWLSM